MPEFLDYHSSKATCLFPISADEPLGESLVWKAVIHGAEEELRDRFHGAEKTVQQRIEDAPARSSREPRPGGGPAGPAPAPAPAPGPGRPRSARQQLSALVRLADGPAAAACARAGDLEAAAAKAAEGLRRPRLDPRQQRAVEALLETPLAKSLKDAAEDVAASARRLEGDFVCAAEPGFYCLSSLLVEQRQYLTSFEICALTRTINPCPPGFYCKGGDAQPKACPRGSSCQLATKEPLDCGSGHVCPISALKFKCQPGYNCFSRQASPDVCWGGYYCPDGILLQCPEGSFCGTGSSRPTTCPWFASCPAGSKRPDFRRFARWSLVMGIFVWVCAMHAVPRWIHAKGGCIGALPAATTVAILSAAWAAWFELPQVATAGLLRGADKTFFSMLKLVGGSPHSTGLVFLTLMYLFLLHGFFISPRIGRPAIRTAVDLAMCLTICLAFSAYMRDWAAVLFIGSMWPAFRILWLLLTQQGPLALRIGLLVSGLALLGLGFVRLGCGQLAKLLAFALGGSVVKELLWEFLKDLYLAFRRRMVEGMDSVLSDTSFRPLTRSLVAEPFNSENPEAHPATAARVVASARASLAESGAGAGPARTSDPQAWSAWLAYHRGTVAEGEEEEGIIDINDGAEGSGGVSFDLRNVSYCLDNERKLLHDLTFTVPGAAKVAIMGASGSGKTTLLSVLSGRCGDGRFAGELRLDGTPLLPWQMAELRPLIGYVPQDDVMHHNLSVRENIAFQANLRLQLKESASSGKDEAFDEGTRGLVEEVMCGLGLRHTASRQIGDGLSGGQRKRVSIGMEVVTRPRILLLDEPSSGLDSSTAYHILRTVLRGASTDGCTTFATIHQPRWSTLGLFDMVVLLAPGGHLCFAGPVVAMKAYFREVLHVEFAINANPADVVIDVCTFESARKMVTSGIWKNPPQCLRAVLFPTPQVVHEECQSQWQQEEYGRLLASLWRSFSAATRAAAAGLAPSERPEPAAQPRAVTVEGRQLFLQPLEIEEPWGPGSEQGAKKAGSALLEEARARAAGVQWGQQVWLHVARTLLTTCRALWPSVTLSQLLLAIVAMALATAFSDLTTSHIFGPTNLLHLLLSIFWSIAALRLFGGEEQQVARREGCVCSLWQVLFCYVGKDLASLSEMVLSTMCFVLTFWPSSGSYASGSDFAAFVFAGTYCVWGMTHIWAILFPWSICMLLSVIVPFLDFLFSGIQPAAPLLLGNLGWLGSLLLLASPNRWTTMFFVTRHVLSPGATYFENSLLSLVREHFQKRAFSIDDVRCPDNSANVLERWAAGKGHTCHTGQLFLLGFLFRFIAAWCLLLTSSSKASGGQLPLGLQSPTKSHILRDAIIIFLVFFLFFEVLLLGQTY